MIFIYPGTLSTFSGKRETALNAGYIEVNEQIYSDLVETKKKWQDGEIVDDPTYEARKAQERKEAEERAKKEAIAAEVTDLKKKLSDSDYAVIKIAEGAATKEEYAALIENRKAWRARINELTQDEE